VPDAKGTLARKPGTLLAFALPILALLVAAPASSAKTASFPAISVRGQTAVFAVHGVDKSEISGARLRDGRRSYRVAVADLRGIGRGRVNVHLPARSVSVGKDRAATDLRLTLVGDLSATTNLAATRGGKGSGGKEGGKGTGGESTSPPPSGETENGISSNEPVYTPPPPTSSQSGVTIPADALYVSASSGNDANPGTQSAPWRTLAKAVATASAGDTVVLEPGTYGGVGQTTNFSRSGTTSAPIVFTSVPGAPKATIHGYVRITGSNLHLDSFLFEGPTGAIVAKTSENPGGQEVQVSIMYGSGVELTNSEVKDNAWHAGVFISQATGIHLSGDYIHDNGDASTGANLDHGVYWCSGSGSITDSRIEDNVAYGVQLYPSATNVTVSHDTISGNGRGGVIVSHEASDNTISNNLITGNKEYGIRAYSLTGSGNVAKENLIWDSGQATYGSGITFTGTVTVNPTTLTSGLAGYGDQ